MQLEEQFKPIKGYEGLYEISNLGRVKRLNRTYQSKDGRNFNLREIILTPCRGKSKYYFVGLSKNGKRKTHRLHHLVWDHFGNKKRRDGYHVDHIIEGTPKNNSINNLQLLTVRENVCKYYRFTNGDKIGYSFHIRRKKWQARIFVNGKGKHLGYFDTEEEASNRYSLALKQFLNTGKISIKTPSFERKTSKYIGVCYDKSRKLWKSEIRHNNKRFNLGRFKNEYDAHIAYEEAKRRLYE